MKLSIVCDTSEGSPRLRTSDKTFGELSAEEKNSFSMRKIAVEKLKEYLNANKISI